MRFVDLKDNSNLKSNELTHKIAKKALDKATANTTKSELDAKSNISLFRGNSLGASKPMAGRSELKLPEWQIGSVEGFMAG